MRSLPSSGAAGFALISGLIIMGSIGAGVMVLTDMMTTSLRKQGQNNIATTADLIRLNIQAYAQDQNGWQFTLNAPANTASLGCLRTGSPTPCVNDVGGPIELFDAAGNPIYPTGFVAPGSYGFSPNGTPCQNFSPTGSDACPFRIDLSWKAVCSGACTSPNVRLIGNLTYTPATSTKSFAINTSNLSINQIRDAAPKVTCRTRMSTASTKIDCGMKSSFQCQPGEVALSAGMWSPQGNCQLRDSYPIPQNDGGIPNGWEITINDYQATQSCTSNLYTPIGTVLTATLPNAPQAQITGKTYPNGPGTPGVPIYMGGAAAGICCKLQ